MKMYINKVKFMSMIMSSHSYGTKFSRDALDVIYDELEEIHEGEFVLDIPEVCSLYSEYKDEYAFNSDQFGNDVDSYGTMEEIMDNNSVLLIPSGGFLIRH